MYITCNLYNQVLRIIKLQSKVTSNNYTIIQLSTKNNKIAVKSDVKSLR